MRYIPPHERDTRYPLWCINYGCRVPWNQMRTVEDIELYGVPSTGDADFDRETASELRDVQIPVERIAELVGAGARVMLRDPEKHVKEIYNAIQLHLSAWSHRMNGFSINSVEIPRDDLRLFDELANILWPLVQACSTPGYTGGAFAALIRGHGGFDRNEQMALLFPDSVKKEEDTEHQKRRGRMSDFFMQ